MLLRGTHGSRDITLITVENSQDIPDGREGNERKTYGIRNSQHSDTSSDCDCSHSGYSGRSLIKDRVANSPVSIRFSPGYDFSECCQGYHYQKGDSKPPRPWITVSQWDYLRGLFPNLSDTDLLHLWSSAGDLSGHSYHQAAATFLVPEGNQC